MKDLLFNKKIDLSSIISDDTEFIPLLSAEDEEIMNNETLADVLPVLPLKNTVLFPGVVIPITVGRDKSINLIRDAYKKDRTIGVVAQKNDAIEDPGPDDLNKTGTVAHLIKILQMPDGSTTAIIQGKRLFELAEVIHTDPYIIARINPIISDTKYEKDENYHALIDTIKDMALQIIRISPNIPSDAAFAIKNIESHHFLLNFISSNLNISVKEKQEILDATAFTTKANLVLAHLNKEVQLLELKNQIQSKVKVDIDKQQRDYFLSQQLKTIQEELGGNPHEQKVLEMKEKAKNKKWSTKVAEAFNKEIDRLQRLNPAAAEYSIQMNYVETMLDLPWDECTKDSYNLKKAQNILDKDHYGLEKIKERIIEHLAVLKLKGNMKAPILCLYGPPGVGKTSLGKSIARSLGRNYVRISLGGLKDESEIRGHRKTYIGAMPGRIIQSIKKAKSSNPVFVLDEIDKVGSAAYQGDPSSALLEVLDPEQNNAFYDNYLEIDYDLSNILFIATANNLSTIQPALRDRMEIIEITGYLLEEKLEIARRHLITKQLEEHGLSKKQIAFSDEAIVRIIENYTRESGVRELEKKIATVIRRTAKKIVMGEKTSKVVEASDIDVFLGVPPFQKEKFIDNNTSGVATGLAWTSVGGEILFIEVSLSKGKGNLTLTGNLGEVMKESATIAFQYLKSHADKLSLEADIFEKFDVHIHVPEGATPKDGPSAGITIFTALASAFTRRKVKLQLAMTGEITLRGKVLPVGGIKEKILAAKRAGINEIIISSQNRKDIEDIPEKYLQGVQFIYIDEMIDLIDKALLEEKAEVPLLSN